MPAAIIPAVAAIGGGLIAANASKKAADTQAQAANNASDLAWQQYQQTRADQAPWRDAGSASLSQLTGGLTPGGEFNRPFTMADYQADPGYQFRIQQGEQAINRAATANGSRYSGATLKALNRFNSDQASNEFGNAYNRYNNDLSGRFNRLASVAQLGQTSTNQTAMAGQNAASTAGNYISNAGAANASGYIGASNAFNGTLGTLTNNYQLSQLADALKQNSALNQTDSSYISPRVQNGAVENKLF